MISAKVAKLSQPTIDEGRSLAQTIARLDMNIAKWVARCLEECGGSKPIVRSEWKKRLGFTEELASAIMHCHDTWSQIPDSKVWKAVGLLGASKIRALRTEDRQPVVEKIHAAVERGETVTLDEVRKLVDDKRGVRSAKRRQSLVTGRFDKMRISGSAVEEIRSLLESHDLVGELSESTRIELGFGS